MYIKLETLQDIVESIKKCKNFCFEERPIGIYWIIYLPTEEMTIVDISKEDNPVEKAKVITDLISMLKRGN